ncbi:MAG: dethiobiotin synthase [Flavobacteriales bacterium]|jgi:dethiobiotin synthetase|nr:dethiobiotin synthase [Flavobacteriales bacterium]
MSVKGLFITGIGTDVGKTVASAIITKALQADYWKPVQCGDLTNSDSVKIEGLTGLKTLPEAFRLNAPMSPHAAADIEGVELSIDKFELPQSDKTIVVEGAGGVLVPLSSTETYLDLMVKLNLPIVLVTRHYLGSINHTMLSWNVLKSAGINVIALVISGTPNTSTESYFVTQMDVPFIRINELEEVNSGTIAKEAVRLRSLISELADWRISE